MQHVEAVCCLINDTDNVLDVGGASQPFMRADSVIDIVPYSKANFRNVKHHNPQRFTQKTWFQQDICDYRTPWPFKDKEFDFSVAGHVFEDIRDPVFAMSEMIRVSKRGYVEVPSRFWEQTRGLQHPGVCGLQTS